MIYTQDYNKLLNTHIESGADITLLYHSVDNAKEYFLNCYAVNLNKQKGVLSLEQNHGNTKNKNIFINNYRKIVRDQTFVDTTDNYYHLNLPQDSGFESTEGAYDLKEMHRIVNALPREYKIPFSMHVSGFKYREIAEKLGLPLGTVKSRIFFTRQRLQQELKDFV